MQLGTDPWQAAEYVGMSVKTLLENYGHHHPDYRAAHGKPSTVRHRLATGRTQPIVNDHRRTCEKLLTIQGSNARPFVWDEGVVGSNPSTPTSLSGVVNATNVWFLSVLPRRVSACLHLD